MTGLRDELLTIYRDHGRLTPPLVVEAATPDDSPLHHRFEWDDAVAGHQYRLVQAREIIRSVKVAYKPTPDDDEQRVRAFVPTYSPEDPDSGGYAPVEEAMADDFTSKLVLRAFERELASLRRSYGHLAEFRDMVRSGLLEDTA